jgi:hypothetical protein
MMDTHYLAGALTVFDGTHRALPHYRSEAAIEAFYKQYAPPSAFLAGVTSLIAASGLLVATIRRRFSRSDSRPLATDRKWPVVVLLRPKSFPVEAEVESVD